MKVSVAIISFILLKIVGCSEIQYEVPEPLFEVFSPKGLRVSIADSNGIQSVEFFLTVPRTLETLSQEVKNPDGGYWIFWNSDVALNLNEEIQYKIMVKRRNLFWKREGVHVVPKVLSLATRLNDTDCSESQKQKIIAAFPKLEENSDRNVGSIKSGRTSSVKSAYSMYKSSDIKPITKSKMSTTSGTFYLKPSGVMEATGYKSGSSFDSTKNEGEQWEHYQSELTAEELENMRHLYGSGFHGFPELTDKLFPGTAAKVYAKSYMSSESKSVPGEVHGINFGENSGTQQFHQIHKTHESSSVTRSKPVFQFHDTFSSGRGDVAVSRENSEKSFKLDSVNKLPNPLPPQGTMFRATEFVKEEHIVPQTKESEVYLKKESSAETVPQKIVHLSNYNEESSSQQNQEIIKPTLPLTGTITGRSNQLEFSGGKLKTVESFQDYRNSHYLGSIFSSYRSPKPKSPDECNLIPEVDYNPSGNPQKIEKFSYELSCLASLAEISLTEEIALLKRKNLELLKKFEVLENDVKRLTTNCKCY